MPNLRGLGLQNFRTFKDLEYLEFAPITLITGANNAGKSSIIKAIELLANNFKEGIIREELDFSKMRHELGGLRRILNYSLQNEVSEKKSLSSYSRIHSIEKEFGKESNNEGIVRKPILNTTDDLVFVFPIMLGGGRKLEGRLELRYETIKTSRNLKHNIKSISILYGTEHIHWSNIIGFQEDPEDGATWWELNTSIDLKSILKLISKYELKEIKHNLEPNERTQEYFELNFFQRITKYGLGFDLPFFQRETDGYEKFQQAFNPKKSLFSSYTGLSKSERIKLEELEKEILDILLLGTMQRPSVLTDSFKRDLIFGESKIEQKINAVELGKVNNKNIFDFNQLSTNAKLYRSLLDSIGNDFTKSSTATINRFKYVYSLPRLRGRNREWFIDEQTDESVELIKGYSSVEYTFNESIKSFVEFWLGKGEVSNDGIISCKGFNIGESIKVVRTEDIGLTKIFIKNFDETLTPLIDLGYGISQVLPIIMKISVIASKQERIHEYDFNNNDGYYEQRTYYYIPSTLLIEEPESNLHPALQSKLAELFLDAASRFNIQFILETHSEYFIYKLQSYIGRKIVTPQDVKIYYLNHPNTIKDNNDKEYVNQVEVSEDGSIDYEKYFGAGFFDEQANLKLSLLNIQRDRFFEDFENLKKEHLSNEDLLRRRQRLLDRYSAKLDFRKHKRKVRTVFPAFDKFKDKTIDFLASGYHLFEIIDDNTSVIDYAPAILQFGRAVENEVLYFFKTTKDFLLDESEVVSWISRFTSKKEVITTEENQSNINDFKKFIAQDQNDDNGKKYKLSFGQAKNILLILYHQTEMNLNQVALFRELLSFLSNHFFQDWNEVRIKIPLLLDIVNKRNEAAHTYSEVISREFANSYLTNTENFLLNWSNQRT